MQLSGLIAAPYTPFKEDGSIALEMVKPYAAHLASSGVNGAFICGTTGEGNSLSTAERIELANVWKQHLPRDMALVVHVGHLSIEECRTLSVHAESIGADAIAAIAPGFYKPASIDDLVDWCAGFAADAPKTPFYYYHMPAMTGVNFSATQFLERAAEKIPTLAGVKFTHENLMDYAQALVYKNGRYNILFGRDEILLAGLSLGAKGAVGSTYNFAAPLFSEIIRAWEAGNVKQARATQMKAIELIQTVHNYGGIPAGKAVMKIIGIDCGGVRPPLRTLTDAKAKSLRQELQTFRLAASDVQTAVNRK